MKFKIPFLLAAFTGVLAVAFNGPYFSVDSSEKESVLIKSLMEGLNYLHYKPKKLNDDFSEKAFDQYLNRLDYGRRFLTQADVDQLSQYRDKLDNQADSGTYEFFDLSLFLYDAGIARAKGYYESAIAGTFDFDKKEFVETDGEKKGYPKGTAEQKEHWRKAIKYEILTRIEEKLQEQTKTPVAEGMKSFAELEKDARESVKKIYDGYFKRLSKLKRKDHLSTYLNALTSIHDPHTGYFAPIDKENFDIGMSNRLEGIGARLSTDGDNTKVVMIVPGSPSWKQGDLKVNDLILKVGQGEEEPIDVQGWTLDDVVSKIRGKKGTEVRLTVKKEDGSIQVVPITRDVVIMEDSRAKSAVLENSNPELGKVGYIYLPRFYADFEGKGGGNCYVDVKKEIEKIKKENVSGVILDLRDNGGGSLNDVVKMSGLFIEEGPIVQVAARGYEPTVLKDKDPSVQYDGPLIVMVNSFSASASEILAAALQDYERAVIVGSKSTFGKGTVQRFIDLDRMVRGQTDVKPLGSLKLTIQKFYRVNGGTTQLEGVQPDVILPDNYQYIKIGEKDRKYPMQWSKIEPAEYGQDVYKVKGLDKIVAASQARVEASKDFQLITENAQLYKEQREDSDHPLDLKTYKTEQEELDEKLDKFEDLFKNDVPGLRVGNLMADKDWIAADTTRIGRNEAFIKGLKKDVYLEETLHIMEDLIKESGQ